MSTAGGAGQEADPRGPTRIWELYGYRLASDHPFVNHLRPAEGDPDLAFGYVPSAPLPPGWDRSDPIYESEGRIDEHTSYLYVFEIDDCTVFRFSEVAEFYLLPDRILCQVLDEAYAYMVELHLLGAVMSYRLERDGVPAIHAAAVAVGKGAIGFLATNKGGKSTLAAGFIEEGHALITDDVLAIDARGGTAETRPSYPQMRMWPDQAARFVRPGGFDERVHPWLDKRRIRVGAGGFGRFCGEPRPLKCLYLPERSERPDVEVSELPFAESVFALARHSFLADLLERAEVRTARFATLARIARQVPVRRLRYPDGVHHLPDIVAALIADAGRGRGNGR